MTCARKYLDMALLICMVLPQFKRLCHFTGSRVQRSLSNTGGRIGRTTYKWQTRLPACGSLTSKSSVHSTLSAVLVQLGVHHQFKVLTSPQPLPSGGVIWGLCSIQAKVSRLVFARSCWPEFCPARGLARHRGPEASLMCPHFDQPCPHDLDEWAR